MLNSSQSKRPKKLIIFDFDGVLADSFSALYDLNREAMARIGIPFTEQDYRDLFMGNVHSGFRYFIKDDSRYFDFLEFKKENFENYYSKATLYPGAEKFIKFLHSKFILAISSSSNEKYIKNLLRKKGLLEKFNWIFGNGKTSKRDSIGRIIKLSGLGAEFGFMISDTVGDILVAKDMGLKTIGVVWGFHSKEILKKSSPDFLAESFDSLAALLS